VTLVFAVDWRESARSLPRNSLRRSRSGAKLSYYNVSGFIRPDMDGFEATAVIRSREGRVATRPAR
jgi:hypothetical protein